MPCSIARFVQMQNVKERRFTRIRRGGWTIGRDRSRGRAGGPDPSRSQKPRDPEIGVGYSQPGIMPASSARHVPAYRSPMSISGHA